MHVQQLFGLILLPVASMGVICNGLVVIATWKSRSLSHSFSLLTGNQALINGLHSTIFLLYIMPMYVLDIHFYKAHSNYVGFVLMMCYDLAMYSHFWVAINRFCAVFLPIAYRTVFGTKVTMVIIGMTFLLSLTTYTVFFIILPCKSSYNPDRWTLTYNYDVPLCLTYGLYDTAKLISLTTFDVVVDMITIAKVRRTRNFIRKGQPTNTAVKKKEVDFLKQSFTQSLYVFLAMPAFMVIPMYTSSKMVSFVVGNVLWCMLHALDGVFTLTFNSEVRKSLQQKRIRVVTVTAHESRSKSSV